MTDKHFMQMAINKAYEGIELGQSPFAACIVKDNEVIACDHNIVLHSTDITAHGEIHAIRNACKKINSIHLSGAVIYSTCEPCPMCFTAIHWARIKKIVYGLSIEDAAAYGFNELTVSNELMKTHGGSDIEIVPHFMRDECIELFEYWNKHPKKAVY